MRTVRILIPAVAATLLLAACGAASTSGRTAASPPPTETAPPAGPSQPAMSPTQSDISSAPSHGATLDAPPDLIVASDAATSRRRPYTYCWSADGPGVCVDGQPTADDRVDVRGPLRLSLPVDDWTLTATRSISLDDPDRLRVPLRTTGTGDWVVAEQLPAGRLLLEIAGRGPEGDAFWLVPVTMLGGP